MLFQIYGTAHSASHGDEPHEHEGVACAIGALTQDQTGVLPTPVTFTAPTTAYQTIFTSAFTSASPLAPRSRAPPPRAPPL